MSAKEQPSFNHEPPPDLREEEPHETPSIVFERYFAPRVIDTALLLAKYDQTVKDPVKDIQRRYGSLTLREAATNFPPVATELAFRIVEKTQTPADVVLVVSSHLPQNQKEQRMANDVRRALADVGMVNTADATHFDRQTFSTACSGGVVALDWLKNQQHELEGANVLVVIDETGYRRTLPPVERDSGRSGLIFSDGAIAMQFQLGRGVTVLDSEVIAVEDMNQLLCMKTPKVDDEDPYLTVIRSPYADEFTMKGPELRTFFGGQLLEREEGVGENDIERFIRKSGISHDQISFFLGHQASSRMVEAFNKWAQSGKFHNMRYVGKGIYTYGNTSSASTFLDLEDGIATGNVSKGDTGLFVVYGGGLVSAKALVRLG